MFPSNSFLSQLTYSRKVKWAVANDVKFLAQAGGHGSSTSSNIGEGDIIINLRGMRSVIVDDEAMTAVISAGTLIGEAVSEVHKHKAHISIYPPSPNPLGLTMTV
jgi:FAD/FMN-containing dehydrogenase